MTREEMWNDSEPIKGRFDIAVPSWLDAEISPATVAAIMQGGCNSGAYMPAVTYHQAMATMNEHGDAVLEYIDDILGEVPAGSTASWHGMAVHFLSTAVELWATEQSLLLDGIDDE